MRVVLIDYKPQEVIPHASPSLDCCCGDDRRFAPVDDVSGDRGRGGNGAEQLPAVCIANFYASPAHANPFDTLRVGIALPDFPAYWDLVAPAGSFATAFGTAVATPSGVINVTCSARPSFGVGVDPIPWPIGKFSMPAPAWTARGGQPVTGIGARIYTGQATVTTDYQNGQIQIIAHLKYDRVQG